ncbi:MAG: Coenzyme F420 hydrogenase/dehydrogenase, beta subunit C-terminal domain [Lachnospiraceae bacterium]|nr:Coenzyme F420 hydrogenase/dehydrogenase, beta subunit C-terminal domain [Lachnospiraceae bacterium]
MEADTEGFLFPVIDTQSCIECGKCRKICPALHETEEIKPKKVFAAVNKNEEIRERSSSGGVFFELAKETIRNGGCVYGARFTDDWSVRHVCAETLEEVMPLMKSKYVQSDVSACFAEIRLKLKLKQCVLFCGTPCQIAGLKAFLGHEYDNLFCIETCCHGVPSPKVWSKYLDEELSMYGIQKAELKNYSFRTKVDGQTEYKLVATDYLGNEFGKYFYQSAYMSGFLTNLTLRQSCMRCKAKKGRSGADIALGDLWNSYKQPPFNDSKGTCLVLAYTEKGVDALRKMDLQKAEIDFSYMNKSNSAFLIYQLPHPKRKEFFERLDTGENVTSLLNELSPLSRYWRAVRRIIRMIQK